LTDGSVGYWETDWKAIYTYEFRRASLEVLFMIESSTLAWLDGAKCPTYEVAVKQQSTSVIELRAGSRRVRYPTGFDQSPSHGLE